MAKILVVGSINMDSVYHVPHIVQPGETLHSTSVATYFGGKGANQAVTAGQLGAEVYFVGAVGEDTNGALAIDNLERKNVKTVFVKQQGITGQAIIQVAQDGENAIILVPGANHSITPEQLDNVCDCVESADILLLQLEIPMLTIEKAVALATKSGTRIILNPAPARPLTDEVLQRVSVLTPNETELALLTGFSITSEESLKQACQQLLHKGVAAVVVTLGSNGSFYMTNETSGYISAQAVEVVDTTGAGDAFNGALAVALGDHKPLQEAITYATKIAGYAVTQQGAQPLIK